jgi:hypothetical protein
MHRARAARPRGFDSLPSHALAKSCNGGNALVGTLYRFSDVWFSWGDPYTNLKILDYLF